jgi:LacI family transcriptional regulator
MRSVPVVGLVGSLFRGYGNDAIRGVAEYARRFGPWQFSMRWLRVGVFSLRHSDLLQSGQPRDLKELDGILYHKDFTDDEVAGFPSRLRVPVVSFQQYQTRVTPWQVWPDHRGIGRVAAEEFVKAGFRHMAYCPLVNLETAGDDAGWDRERCEAFGQVAQQAGADLHVYPQSPSKWGEFSDEMNQHRLERWLCSLPKPVGLMAACDERARHVLMCAQAAGVRIPEEVAVLGVDNEPWAGIAPMGLSSIEPDAFRAGYVAAGVLHRLMEGQTVDEQIMLVPPLRIVCRQSSTTMAIDDSEVVTAVRFIAENARRLIKVQDVVDAVVISRRGLERRFRRAVKHSIQEEIHRAHLNRAKNLLEDVAIPLKRVAGMSGFISARAMDALFSRTFAMTPTEYRRRMNAARDAPSDPMSPTPAAGPSGVRTRRSETGRNPGLQELAAINGSRK